MAVYHCGIQGPTSGGTLWVTVQANSEEEAKKQVEKNKKSLFDKGATIVKIKKIG